MTLTACRAISQPATRRQSQDASFNRNWRLIAFGTVLLVLAVLYFLSMWDMTPWSNNPVALMRTVG